MMSFMTFTSNFNTCIGRFTELVEILVFEKGCTGPTSQFLLHYRDKKGTVYHQPNIHKEFSFGDSSLMIMDSCLYD